ncbi:MAG: VCBS repeat-containing protein, partial [Candidatus Marinimicrobia bacterium]|nr:VCBS repeat-containing protein [Candidatus Neomarinimicrobiota bacterium]
MIFYILGIFLLLTTTGFGYDDESNYWVDGMFNGEPGNQLIPELDDAYGVAFRDINGDKLPDIYVTRFRELNRLLINRGGDTPFEDRTIQTGLGGNLASLGQRNLELGASIVDFNDDGNSDVIVTGWGAATHLFEANRQLEFINITNLSGIKLPISGNCAVWADIDLDGDLDLFITDEHGPNHLYVQAEPGRFVDRAMEFGVDAEQISQGATFGDLDGDGYPDLYVCNWFAPDLLYRNIEGIVFQRVKLPLSHLTEPLRSNGVWFGDIDNDADLDILVTDRQRTSRLYRNDNLPVNNGWAFTDITADFGLLNPYPAYSGLMADFNNDGWRDIYFANIGPNQLFLNQRGKGFSLVYQQSISSNSYLRHYSTGAAVADFDNDGDLDLFVSNKDTASALYVNPLAVSSFIRIRVAGGKSNREGIGTKIRLYRQPEVGGAPTLVSYQEITGGSGYLSIGERVVHLGVRSQEKYRVEVVFPSGKEKFYNNLIPNQQIIVRENNAFLMLVYRASDLLAKLLSQPEFLGNMLLFIFLAGVLVLYIYISLRRYRWTAQRAIWLVLAIILILFIGLIFIPEYGLRSILLGQLVVLMVIIGTVTGFSERIRQLSEKRYGYRPILKQFSERLINIRNNDELYQQLTDVIFQSIPLKFCAIYEINKHQANLVCNVGSSPISSFTITNELLKTLENNPIIVNADFVDNQEHSESISGSLLISVRYSTGLLALIVLGNRKDGMGFKDDDSDVFTVLGSQAALAIENNRYIDETRVLAEQVSAARVREHYI